MYDAPEVQVIYATFAVRGGEVSLSGTARARVLLAFKRGAQYVKVVSPGNDFIYVCLTRYGAITEVRRENI